MKKALSFLLALVMVLVLVGCGKSKMVLSTEKAISDIGEVSLSSLTLIEEAERSYKILSDKEKESVENRAVLLEARKKYEELVAAKQKEETQKNKSKSNEVEKTENSENNEYNGYFEVKEVPINNEFGKEIDKYKYYYAVADAVDRYGDSAGPVMVFYNYDVEDGFKFIPGTKTGSYPTITRIALERDGETYYVVPERSNYVTKRNETEFFDYVFSELKAGNDITFSIHGGKDYIFTIHGEGFSDLID